MSLFDVRHQPRAHRMLQRALACRRMPHAYLFAGPEGVGKEMLAARLAAGLLCEAPIRRPMPAELGMGREAADALDACGSCQDCHLVAVGTHPDYLVVYRQLIHEHPDSQLRKQKATVLSVEVIRHFLVQRLGLQPSRGRAKLFVVREAERLNDAAQNALLKSLEEPPDRTFIILLTSSLDRMLPTTRSRCQQVVFQPLPTAFVSEELRRLRPQAAPQELAYLGAHSGGSLGAALRMVDDGLYPLKRAWGERLAELVSAGTGFAANSLSKSLAADAASLGAKVLERDPEVTETDAARAGAAFMLAAMAEFYADALRLLSGAGVAMTNADQVAVVETLAGRLSAFGLQRSLAYLAQAESNLARNANIELSLDALFIQLSRAARGRPAAIAG